jgi:hypothetical protein
VTREHSDGILQGKQFLFYSLQQEVFVTSREVPTTNPLTEKNISPNNGVFLQKMNTQAARAVTRNMVDAHGRAEQICGPIFVQQEVGFERLDFQFKPPPPKEFPILHHGCGLCMHPGLAAMSLDDCCGVSHVIKMGMGDYQKIHLFVRKGLICLLGSVEKDSASGSFVVETIRVEDAASEGFEPIHEKMVRENDAAV